MVFIMLCFILLVPPHPRKAKISVPVSWARVRARVSAGAVAANAAVSAEGRAARARRPRGSHLGKSGWRPGRCAGPSSHWGGCWPSPTGSTAWLGRPGARRGTRAGREREREREQGARAPRARARLRGTRARGELSPSLRFREEIRAPGGCGGNDTRHPLGSPSHPRRAIAPAQTRPAGGGRGGAGVRCARVGALVPLRGYPPGAGNGSAADAGCMAGPGGGDSEPGALLAGARGAPVRTSRLCTPLRPVGVRTSGALGEGEVGMSEGGRRGHPAVGTRESAENYQLQRVWRGVRSGGATRSTPIRPPHYPPSVPRRPCWKDTRAGLSPREPTLLFCKQSGVARVHAQRSQLYCGPWSTQIHLLPTRLPATASTATSRPPRLYRGKN